LPRRGEQDAASLDTAVRTLTAPTGLVKVVDTLAPQHVTVQKTEPTTGMHL